MAEVLDEFWEYSSFEEYFQENGKKYVDNNFINESIDNYPQVHKLDKFLKGVHGYVAGGVFKYLFNNENPRDIDIYFTSEEALDKSLENVKKDKYWENTYTTKKVCGFLYDDGECEPTKVEFIKSFTGNPEEMLTSFDFIITKFAYWINLEVPKDTIDEAVDDFLYDEDSNSGEVIFHKKFFEDLFLKRLELDSYPRDPISCYNRLVKYTGYGFTPCLYTKFYIAKFLQGDKFIQAPEDIAKAFYEGGID